MNFAHTRYLKRMPSFLAASSRHQKFEIRIERIIGAASIMEGMNVLYNPVSVAISRTR
jgi:hypothetical protein